MSQKIDKAIRQLLRPGSSFRETLEAELGAALSEIVREAQREIALAYMDFIHDQYFDPENGPDARDFPNWQYIEIESENWRREHELE